MTAAAPAARLAPRTVFLQGRGLRLAADVAGPDDGEPVVLLHGGGQTRFAWSSAMRALAADGCRVVSLDLRGHGASDWAADGDYGPDAMAADLAAVVATLDRPPVLIGASLGGIASLLVIADAAAAGLAAPARALVLVDVAPRIEQDGVEQILAFLARHLDGFATVDEAAAAVAAYNPLRAPSRRGDGLMKNLRRGDDGRLYWHWDPKFLQAHPADGVGAMNRRLAWAAAHVGVPVLLVRGLQSTVVSADSVADLRARMPHAEVVDIAHAGHMVAGDRNDVFNDAVLGYLRRLRG